MVKITLLLALMISACSRQFVIKPSVYTKPVMVGDIRQLGGEKIPRDTARKPDMNMETEMLDTSTSAAEEPDRRNANALDHRLTAATLMGERDAIVSDVRFGSYVFFPILFYFDKDWLGVSGFTEEKLSKDPERVYNLNPVIVRPKTKTEKLKEKKEKTKIDKKKKANKTKKSKVSF